MILKKLVTYESIAYYASKPVTDIQPFSQSGIELE